MKEFPKISATPSSEIEDKILEETDSNKLAELLDHALQYGDLKELEDLFKKGMGVNQPDPTGRTALQIMSFKGNIDAVKMLLSRGADINRIYLYQDRVAMTALDAAREGKKQTVVDLLLANGACAGRDIKATEAKK